MVYLIVKGRKQHTKKKHLQVEKGITNKAKGLSNPLNKINDTNTVCLYFPTISPIKHTLYHLV